MDWRKVGGIFTINRSLAAPYYSAPYGIGSSATVARIGGLAVAGAAYHGVGIPACIASGRSAARVLL